MRQDKLNSERSHIEIAGLFPAIVLSLRTFRRDRPLFKSLKEKNDE